MFATMRWMIPVAHPLVAVFICYYFVIPYRLIIENRRSWEYYQKNRLLTQVEELKSNFMRMMSHDLKTPLARIQGMADVIRGDGGLLNETQQVALDTISQSSEELTDFIASILSLSRIESKEMKLQLRSRDINQLLRDVVRKVDYLAKKKNIQIVMENSIKYSPEGTKVLVTTEELNGEAIVQVADQGRGIPAEDLQHIFERFYRARNSRINTAGNGLGLYLARYFVELHNGHVEVESLLDKGSTFTVQLPMNLHKETTIDRFESENEHPGGLYV
jgi:signal transduction histidine kinase